MHFLAFGIFITFSLNQGHILGHIPANGSNISHEIFPTPSLSPSSHPTTFSISMNFHIFATLTSTSLSAHSEISPNSTANSFNNNNTITITTPHNNSSSICPIYCNCTKSELPNRELYPEGFLSAKCRVKDNELVRRLAVFSLMNISLYSLNLENNNITNITSLKEGNEKILEGLRKLYFSRNLVPRIFNGTFQHLSTLRIMYLDNNLIEKIDLDAFSGLKNLENLILDHNKLTNLVQGNFYGLDSLLSLSIRYNRLKTWKGYLWMDVPRLDYLNFEGNTNFKVPKMLLRNITVQKIDFITISKKCRDCHFVRINASISRIQPRQACKYLPAKHYPLLKSIHSRFILFEGPCQGNKTCQFPLTSFSALKRQWKDACWELTLKTRYFEYFIAVVAIAANFFVVIVTAFSKPLREKTAFLLVAHMALCDVCIGFYGVGIAHGHRLSGDSKIFRQWRYTICPYYRTLFVLGQFMEVATSFLVTLERYLAIVFCMKPLVRLQLRGAGCLLALFWAIAATLCALIQIVDSKKITDNYMCVLIRDYTIRSSLHISQLVMLILTAFYFVVLALYIHIYIYARRSQRNTGVRRESKLAKRIGIVIVSNFVFFVVPSTFLVTMSAGSFYFDIDPVANSAIRRWFPPISLVINACINPFLFAYRNEKFQTAIKGIFTRSLNRVGSSPRGIGLTAHASSEVSKSSKTDRKDNSEHKYATRTLNVGIPNQRGKGRSVSSEISRLPKIDRENIL